MSAFSTRLTRAPLAPTTSTARLMTATLVPTPFEGREHGVGVIGHQTAHHPDRLRDRVADRFTHTQRSYRESHQHG